MDGFPSGQREQTVNLPAPLSVVRIHPRPPSKSTANRGAFAYFHVTLFRAGLTAVYRTALLLTSSRVCDIIMILFSFEPTVDSRNGEYNNFSLNTGLPLYGHMNISTKADKTDYVGDELGISKETEELFVDLTGAYAGLADKKTDK